MNLPPPRKLGGSTLPPPKQQFQQPTQTGFKSAGGRINITNPVQGTGAVASDVVGSMAGAVREEYGDWADNPLKVAVATPFVMAKNLWDMGASAVGGIAKAAGGLYEMGMANPFKPKEFSEDIKSGLTKAASGTMPGMNLGNDHFGCFLSGLR